MPDGRSFIADGIDRVGTMASQIWQIGFPSGERRRVTNDLDSYTGVSLSADGSVLATVQTAKQAGLWVVQAGGVESRQMGGAPGRTVGALGVAWTPDGRLVFTSDAGGASQLWIARPDGSDIRQLTSGETIVAHPAVSADGRWIYYTGQTPEGVTIRRMGIDGADQRELVQGIIAALPMPSQDGRWVYFMSGAEPFPAAMRVPAGGGAASVVTTAPFTGFDISASGGELIGVAWNQATQQAECGILPTEGGAVRVLADMSLSGVDLQSWRFHPDPALVSYSAVRDGVANLFARPVAGGPERQLTRFGRDAGPEIFYAAWSRDGRVALSRGLTTSDVVLMTTK
jgi:Tol biopolymer transport system component